MADRSIRPIAREIAADWKKPYFAAGPYLRAMHSLDSVNDAYGYDSARSVILYFLSNAAAWRGDAARRVKAELRSMCE